MTEGINSIGVARMIESAVRIAKHGNELDRITLFYVVRSVINECELPDEEKTAAISELKEALSI